VVEAGLARQLNLSDAEAIEGLDTLLRDTVARRMMADVPLGRCSPAALDFHLQWLR
jgi:asparagine synthetase B (glutamine-hydrolysing)